MARPSSSYSLRLHSGNRIDRALSASPFWRRRLGILQVAPVEFSEKQSTNLRFTARFSISNLATTAFLFPTNEYVFVGLRRSCSSLR